MWIDSGDTGSARAPGARLGSHTLLGLLLVGALGSAAGADPIVTVGATPIGGGLVSHAIAVDFQDGLSRSGFIQISFSGNFAPQSALAVGSWPDLQLADPGQATPSIYSLRGGTGGASTVDVVPVATLVLAEGESFTYSGVVSRDGRNFSIVPEPLAGAAAAACLLTLAALRRRER
jgi:hypothetical protein